MLNPEIGFLPNEAGEAEGLGDAGIETFKDAPYASCAREAGQNSNDAAIKLPVRLKFDVISVARAGFEAFSSLGGAIESCLQKAKHEKEIDFFSNAKYLIEQNEIKVLRIEDYNTRGLSGPPGEENTPFHSLLKGSGVSNDRSETSGGSFGIGKNASFAVSDLQTVFYSTVYSDAESGKDAFAAQGKIKLVSHVDDTGVPRRATGYWGNLSGFNAITDYVP